LAKNSWYGDGILVFTLGQLNAKQQPALE
jgi:hypothetical protein